MGQRSKQPPRWANQLLEWFCNDKHLEIIQGDLYELFYDRLESMPSWMARLYFIKDVLDMMRPFAWRPRQTYNLQNQIDMLKNYFKTAYRGLLRRKTYALINILGLSLGILVCIILFATIKTELNYDAFHEKADRIVRFTQIQQKPSTITYRPFMPFPAAKALREDFPDFEKITAIYLNGHAVVQVGKNKLDIPSTIFADEYFLDVFDFKLLKGNKKLVLSEPNTVVLTQHTAAQIFGSQDPIGQVILLDDQLTLKVTGIVKNPPTTTHLSFTMLISYKSFTNDYFPLDLDIFSAWGFTDYGAVYGLLTPERNPLAYERGLESFVKKHMRKEASENSHIYLQPLKDIHFDMRFAPLDVSRIISINTIWAYASLGIFILLVACINFINLSTAQASLKNKEVGIRKVIGARRGQLIVQFMTEAFLLASIATIIGLSMSQLLLNEASELVGFPLSLNWGGDISLWIFVILGVITVSLLAGFYPAFVLSSYRPINTFHAQGGNPRKKLHLRRGLVGFQFLITQVLVIATLVIFQQMQYFQQKDLGYNPDLVLSTSFPHGDLDSLKAVRFKNKLKENPRISEVTLASSSASNNSTLTAGFKIEGKDMKNWEPVHHRVADQDYLKTYDIELIAGRNIDGKVKATPEVLVNEALLRKMAYKNPEDIIGVGIAASWGVGNGKVIGVVKDFHHLSLQNEIAPCIIAYAPEYLWRACIRLKTNQNITESIAYIEQTYKELFPNELFQYQFDDERLVRYYKKENQLLSTFQLFALLAVIIGSSGLFGLISFIALQRTKEIGIRKVLGASPKDIITLISNEFMIILLISFLIASPIAYFLMQSWLEDFAYRIHIQAWVFFVAGIISLGITLLTICYQTIKSALSNPVEALRYE